MLGKAISLVATAFKDKKDKGGKPYFLHCMRVMNRVSYLGEDAMCVAIMHDLIEDTDTTLNDIINHKFNQTVCYNLTLVTHEKGETYDDYIAQIGSDSERNKIAIAVKMADLKDNSDITRIKGLRSKDTDRIKKYHKAYKFLELCV